jgi:hypothetical protein
LSLVLVAILAPEAIRSAEKTSCVSHQLIANRDH